MTSLDPGTQFWIDQGGKDASGQVAWSDLHDSDTIPSEHGPTYRDHVSDDLDSDVRQAVDEARGRAEEREAFDRSKPHRDELTGRYTSSKCDLISSFAGWDKQLRADPHSAADALASHYLRQPPGLLKSTSPPAEGKPPEGMRESWRGDWQRDQDVINAYKAAANEKADREQFEGTVEHRQMLKQCFPHLSFDKALERIVQVDRDLLTNPLEAAGRLGASYGMPVTHGQHRAVENEAKVGQAQQLVDHVVASGQMPGLGSPVVDAATAAILEDRNFPRSGDHFQDLRNAHDLATQQLAAGHIPTAAADPARLQAANEAVAWASRALPRYAELETVIADVLNNPGFQRSGDCSVDIATAHAAAERIAAGGYNSPPPLERVFAEAWQEVQKTEAERVQRESVKRAKRASRSVSGSPSPGASSGQRRDENNSVWDDAAAAVRSARASV